MNGENRSNGKTVNYYKNDAALITLSFPFPPPINQDHKRGLLEKTIVFKNDNGLFKELQKTVNNYELEPIVTVPGLTVSYLQDIPSNVSVTDSATLTFDACIRK